MKHIRQVRSSQQGTSNTSTHTTSVKAVATVYFLFLFLRKQAGHQRAARPTCGRLQHAPACVPGHPRSPRVGACSTPQHAGACSTPQHASPVTSAPHAWAHAARRSLRAPAARPSMPPRSPALPTRGRMQHAACGKQVKNYLHVCK